MSLDHAGTDYAADVEVGVIDAALTVLPSGYGVQTPQNTPFTATSVSLRATTTTLGLFATDTLDITPHLAVTASGRYNQVRIALTDRLGGQLNGRSRYARFNPALGVTYQWSPAVTVYAGYAEGSRTPSPSEIECSNPAVPCLLPSSLASDPPTLRQVTARTWEAGLRGALPWRGPAGGALTWSVGAFRARLGDDIYAVATALGAGYFQNIGATQRRGIELSLRYQARVATVFANYSRVDASFASAFALPSPSNPFGDANGVIRVRPGDRLPGLPRDRLKVGVDVAPRRGWSVGGTVAWVGGQIYRGDEANRLAPLSGYAVVGLHTAVAVTPKASLFFNVANALNARYATFGILGDPSGVGAPGVPSEPARVHPRFQSPAAPRAWTGGLKLKF